jgi:alkanesulfonate monooxygenase SsuD/methylene tetrahydromethanopterin reductase-like flavin-dependent oxidoreductase (luciferase family)
MTTPATTEQPTLREQVARVADLREGLAVRRALWDAARKAFDEEHAELLAEIGERNQHLVDAEFDLRASALTVFSATEDKHPTPGVSIRVTTRVVYDRDEALAWAKAKGVALTLDAKAFEGLAKHDRDLPASVVEDPQATIAKDLRAALREAS